MAEGISSVDLLIINSNCKNIYFLHFQCYYENKMLEHTHK
jgi:hypothetical protein